MPNILFVCQTNQTASPMAAAYLEHKLKELGKASDYQISSAGLKVRHGASVCQGAREALAELGLKPLHIGAVLLSYKQAHPADLIVCTTEEVRDAVLDQFRFAERKTVLLLPMAGGNKRNVFEPRQNSVELNRQCLEMMKPALDAIAQRLA